MKKYTKVVETLAIEWQPGVVLPNAIVVEFAASITPTGTFPAHALLVIWGNYSVIFPGNYVLYGDKYSSPTSISTGMSGYIEMPQPQLPLSEKNVDARERQSTQLSESITDREPSSMSPATRSIGDSDERGTDPSGAE